MLGANVPVCKLTTWGIHNMYKKHKAHPNIELLMLVSDFMVNSMLKKYSKVFL